MVTKTNIKDILSLIETDHREVEQLFKEIKVAKSGQEAPYFHQIDNELTLHAKVEELVFYRAMREYKETQGYVKEAQKEHNQVKELLEEMKKLNPDDVQFKSKLEELIKAVNHHVCEEESEIFPAVRQCMNEEDLQKLGEEFQAAKAKLEPEAKISMN